MRVELNVDLDEHSYNVQLDCDRSIPIEVLTASACATLHTMMDAQTLDQIS